MASALKIMTIATSLSRIYGAHTGVKLEADFSSAKLGRNVHRIAKQTIFGEIHDFGLLSHHAPDL